LALFREAAGHTQHTFAPLTLYGRSTIANVETGGQRAPREFWQRCDEVLGTDGVLTADHDEIVLLEQDLLAATARSSVSAGGFAGAPGDAYVEVERSIMDAARETSEHAMDAGAWAVSDATVEQLRDDATRIARTFTQLTPAVAVRETLRVRNLAVGLLERTRRPGQQQELYLVVAQAAALLASESVDLGLWQSAMEYARAAYTYGEVLGHKGVRAYARGMQATIAYWTGQPAEAVEYAEAAVELAPAGVARVRALSVLARAWSHRGSGDEVQQAITAAEAARAADGRDLLHDVVGGEFGYTEAQQARSASTAWLQVGQPEQATAAAATALELAKGQPGDPWSTVPAEARVDLATCQLLAGGLDDARDTLAPLWSMPEGWRRIGLVGRVYRVQRVLEEPTWRGVPKARRMAQLASGFVSAQGAPLALPPA
jgi:tetratricopeptide (TPR) repeat protein